MRFFLFSLFLILSIVFNAVYGTLDYSRTHCVDYNKDNGNFIFRSNMPIVDDEFAYDTLVSYFQTRAQEECGVEFPTDFNMIDVTLNDAFDNPDWQREKEYWSDYHNFDLGRLVLWPIGLAGIIPPDVFPDEKQDEMSSEDGIVWTIDRLPQRLRLLKDMFDMISEKPNVMLVHCTAGCDRTGEMIGAYRMQYQNTNTYDMFQLDTDECGRSPNYWSATALEWYCVYLQDSLNMDVGDCYNFADCDPFGDCVPADPTSTSTETKSSQRDVILSKLSLRAPGIKLPNNSKLNQEDSSSSSFSSIEFLESLLKDSKGGDGRLRRKD